MSSLWNIMCLCNDFDEKTEREASGNFLDDLCDCDVLKRWVCLKCRDEEMRQDGKYSENWQIWLWSRSGAIRVSRLSGRQSTADCLGAIYSGPVRINIDIEDLEMQYLPLLTV